ncbi:MAG: hypothetical protein RIS36_469 [Pseudomonadota bacterium]
MVQLAKSTKYFELFERRNPGTVRVSTQIQGLREIEWVGLGVIPT